MLSIPYWRTKVEGGLQRVNHSAVVFKDCLIYSFGGYCSEGGWHLSDPFKTPVDLHVFDSRYEKWFSVNSEKWDAPQNAPFRRYGHTVVKWKENAILWGGRNDQAQGCNVLYRYDPETNCWSRLDAIGVKPGARDGHSACVIGDSMYIFGGFDGEDNVYCNTLISFNFQTKRWRSYADDEPCFLSGFITSKPGLPTPRDFHTAVTYHKKILVWGGRSNYNYSFRLRYDKYQEDVHVFDTEIEEWTAYSPDTEEGSRPIGRRSHSSFIFGDMMYVLGGYNQHKKEHYNDIYRLDLSRGFDSLKWIQVLPFGAGPSPRRRQSCCLMGSQLYLFGGTKPNPDATLVVSDSTANDDTELEDDDAASLKDLDDLYILDLNSTLQVICINYIAKTFGPVEMDKLNFSRRLPKSLYEAVNRTSQMFSSDQTRLLSDRNTSSITG